jgi:hypothetical protein
MEGRRFSFQRLGLLLRRDLLSGYRSTVIAMLAVGGFILIVGVLAAFNPNSGDVYRGLYTGLLFLGGFIVTSMAFHEVRLNAQGIHYLSLPGSALEKFLSKLLLTAAGYVVGTLIFFTAAVALTEGINRLVFGRGHPFFNPFARDNLRMLAAYFIAQSVFLLGSIYFRKLHFVKTVLSLVVLALGLIVIGTSFARVVFKEYFIGPILNFGPYMEELSRSGELQTVLGPLAHRFQLAIRILLVSTFAPVCWVVSYLRLRETEV